MTYTEIATRFWRLHRESAFTHTETTLFLFLLNEWHIRRKRGWMDMETRFLEIAVPISRKSLVFARENLRNRGLLDYEPGIGRGSAKYTLCVSNSVSSVNTKGNTKETQNSVCVPDNVSQGNTNSNTKSFVLPEETQSKRKVSPTPPLKENIYSTPTSLNSVNDNDRVLNGIELFGIPEIIAKLKESWEWKESMMRTFGLTEEELLSCLDGYPDHCTNLGETRKTVNEAKRHITNWLRKQQQSRQLLTTRNETRREDRFSERRGTDPSANRAEDYTSTF